MQIKFEPGIGMAIFFQENELKFAMSVLRGINAVVKQSFIQECIDDVERHLAPKRLELVVHNHICDKCFMMVNDKDENTLKITRDGDVMWRHKKCKELKNDRPQ